ncbi:hypothetical protein CB0940_10467 [Cercospora beticola]|uniref:Uncharacterized protein n=1 Tax=Cercospora beticola TaxID=122368 RepID=A0A2G5HUI0_CERBT|nr:hypothetical protein CB0940_10467 [Cercospora beticola]PIA96175.1 hypothetical protein CB0940_10467 [Cercospora beticola]WPB07185.1 hypothetical protein RHO25_011846 [Cercospora beticola]CAK1367147.1 unnamed protein product [Cercospora beticola]
MPHATETLTNGDKPQSKFLSHITSYPAVHDGIETYKTNPYGKKSIEIADGVYTRFGKPVEPYLQRPAGYAAPYLQKADELADSGLTQVETRFPIVKEDTDKVVEAAKSSILAPVVYLYGTWQDEYTKTARHNDRGAGLTTLILALVSTNLKIASDVFQVIADTLGPKYEESKKKSADYVNNAQDHLNNLKNNASGKFNDAQKYGQDKYNEAQKYGQEKYDEAQKYGNEKKDQAKQTKDEAKDQAKQTKDEAKKQANK